MKNRLKAFWADFSIDKFCQPFTQLCLSSNFRFKIQTFALAFVVLALIALVLRQKFGSQLVDVLKASERAPHTIRSPFAIDVVDSEINKNAKQRLLSYVAPVFDHDPDLFERAVEQWQSAILLASEKYKRRDRKLSKNYLQENLGIEVKQSEYDLLIESGFEDTILKSAAWYLKPLNKIIIVDSESKKTFAKSAKVEMLSIVDENSSYLKGKEFQKLKTPVESVKWLSSNRMNSLKKEAPAGLKAFDQKKLLQLTTLLNKYVAANLSFNKKITELRKTDALKAFKPETFRVRRGEVIIHRGELASKKTQMVLEALQAEQKISEQWGRFFLEILLATMALWLLWTFLHSITPTPMRVLKDNLVAALLLLLSIAAYKLTLIFEMTFVARYFDFIPDVFFLFLIPIAAPAMILRFLINPVMSLLFTLALVAGVSHIFQSGPYYSFFVLVSCLVANLSVAKVKSRSDLNKAGLWAAAATACAALLLTAIWSYQLFMPQGRYVEQVGSAIQHFGPLKSVFFAALGGFISGCFASAITLVFTPLLENTFNYTSDLKLLELARMDHPLLKELALRAPGTYHHSIVVGSLSEAGAEAIGANALLARVGSYYHDIGKSVRPEYFTENQVGGVSRHEKTSPQLSAKIIISHVKDGVVLAKKYKLGQDIIDMIEQHHGKSTVKFFFHKAQQNAIRSDEDPAILRTEFQYPGPKPQSKEVALVTLADACEAATRSLEEPTPARIQSMVHKIIFMALEEGVFDDARLTLQELKKVEDAYCRVLMGIHHNRIQYPEQEKGLSPKKSA